MARAGMCSVCGTNVWLTEQGGCINGHGPESISGTYETDTGQPVAERKRTSTGVIIAIILAVVLFLCACPTFLVLGGGALLGIPVFNAAKGDAQERVCYANQRTIEGASQQWLAADPENAIEALDGDAWQSVLVGSSLYLKDAPVCPSGYEYTLKDGEADPCPDHGRYSDEF